MTDKPGFRGSESCLITHEKAASSYQQRLSKNCSSSLFYSNHSYHLHTSHEGECNIALGSRTVNVGSTCHMLFSCFIHVFISFCQMPYSWITMTILLMLSIITSMTQGAPECIMQIINWKHNGQIYSVKCSCLQRCRYCDKTYDNYNVDWCYETCGLPSKPLFADLSPTCVVGRPEYTRAN